jgi:aspartyl-tRNA(Asn)/glutamyl-tRNA(Gln) amidotransferase subunit A
LLPNVFPPERRPWPLINVIGHPSFAVPIGLDTAGLPVGMQIVGAFGADALVLEAGLLPVHG